MYHDEANEMTHYKPFQDNTVLQSSIASGQQPAMSEQQQLTDGKKGDNVTVDCTCCEYLGYGTIITNTLLTLIFGILFIILTAVGKQNVSIHDGDTRCDCTLFAPSVGHGLGVSLLIEVGLLVGVSIFGIVAFLLKNDAIIKIALYCCFVAGGFIAVNYLGFLCMTIAVIVFVATGGVCCSVTSVVVASLSAVIAVFKFVFIIVFLCYQYVHNSD